eukprot:6205853-Pleurochrysis_carterae.AAC.1
MPSVSSRCALSLMLLLPLSVGQLARFGASSASTLLVNGTLVRSCQRDQMNSLDYCSTEEYCNVQEQSDAATNKFCRAGRPVELKKVKLSISLS